MAKRKPPAYKFTDDDHRRAHESLRRIGYRKNTAGKTWEEIYGPEYAAEKREQLRKQSSGPKSDAHKKRLSDAQKRKYAEGYVNPMRGKNLTDEHKARLSATRRARYGTRASINKQVRFTSRYKAWRENVYKRDAYTCQECGINTAVARRRVILEAHHKVELWELIGEKSFEQAMADPVVWDMDNAITLCRPCHRKIPVGPYWTGASSACT